jgi:hypothetical protein
MRSNPFPPNGHRGCAWWTLGCPIGENVAGVDYHQYLGLFDALGQLNAWGHWPEYWPPTWHSTNPVLPPAMAVGEMASESVRDKRSEAAAAAVIGLLLSCGRVLAGRTTSPNNTAPSAASAETEGGSVRPALVTSGVAVSWIFAFWT